MEDHRPHAESDCRAARAGLWWWLRQLLLTGIASFFVCFGISVLISAYRLNDPFSFIMTFFAANLMILISLVMVIGFVLRMWRVIQSARCLNERDEQP
jgi:nitrogen fixation/metabolism regulation signal transduction histidine kinase